MKTKLYETYDYRTKKNYWWTQRDKNTNCFEIRQLDNGKVLLLINEIPNKTFDYFNEAVNKINEMWAS